MTLSEMQQHAAVSPVLGWLGGRGFALKYHGIEFILDPSRPPEFDASRTDLVLCSNADLDGPAVTSILKASTKATVVLPKSAAATAQAKGIPLSRMRTTDADLRIEYFKNGLYARVYAVPSANPELAWTPLGGYPHLGYLIRCGQCTIYHGGQGVPYEGLAARLRPYNVHVALVPIGVSAFSPTQASDLAEAIAACWLVPIHAGGGQQTAFVNHLLFHKPEQRFKVFEDGEAWQVPWPED